MSTLALASGSSNALLLLVSFATLLMSTMLILDRRHDPFRRLAQFRIPKPRGIRFERMSYATLGDTPTRRAWYRNTLAFGVDADSLYLRRSRVIPFLPVFWRLPRKDVRRFQHEYWTVRIRSANPPLNADFGPEFLSALR